MKYKVASIDLIRRLDIFAGMEPDCYNQEFDIPGSGFLKIKADDFLDQRFEDLEDVIGTELFYYIAGNHGYKIPVGEFEGWKGSEDLSLYFAIQSSENITKIIIVSFGEKQPALYKLHVEGIWELSS